MLLSIHGYCYALVGNAKVKPLTYQVLYHGTRDVSVETCEQNMGLPEKGSDIDLIKHVEPPTNHISAFRGTTEFPNSLWGDNCGASEWAGDGGVVYKIVNWPGYNITEVLDQKIPNGKGGYRSPLFSENEIAIPARVPKSAIKNKGLVVNSRGRLVVDF